MRIPNPEGHNYLRVINRMLERGEIPHLPATLGRLTVAHSDHCGIHRGRRCDCQPEVSYSLVEPLRICPN